MSGQNIPMGSQLEMAMDDNFIEDDSVIEMERPLVKSTQENAEESTVQDLSRQEPVLQELPNEPKAAVTDSVENSADSAKPEAEKKPEEEPLKFRRESSFHKNAEQELPEKPVPKILTRIYILAAIPFIVAAVAPYFLGNLDHRQGAALLAWSFTILMATQSMTVGYRLAENKQRLDLHIVVSLIIAALGLVGVLVVAMGPAETFVGLTLMTVPHRFSSLWLARQKIFSPALMRAHTRFVWTLLICHVSVMINMIFALSEGVF